jgi:hypothetical protein
VDPLPTPQPLPASQPGAQATSLYAPDWYPDPTGRFEFRYHNGKSWTGDVAVDGERFLDPLAANSNAVITTSAPFVTPVRLKTHTNGKAIAAFVLAISSVLVGWVPFLCALAVVAAILAVVFGFASLHRIRRDGHLKGRGLALAAVCVAPLGFAMSGVGIWLTVLTMREFDKYANVGEYSVATTRCSVDSGLAHFDGTITNKSATIRSYHVVVDLLRAGTSNSLYTSSVDVEAVEPGHTNDWTVAVPVTQERVDCLVSSVTGPLPFAQS